MLGPRAWRPLLCSTHAPLHAPSPPPACTCTPGPPALHHDPALVPPQVALPLLGGVVASVGQWSVVWTRGRSSPSHPPCPVSPSPPWTCRGECCAVVGDVQRWLLCRPPAGRLRGAPKLAWGFDVWEGLTGGAFVSVRRVFDVCVWGGVFDKGGCRGPYGSVCCLIVRGGGARRSGVDDSGVLCVAAACPQLQCLRLFGCRFALPHHGEWV